jgi:hypothetical protein
MTDNEQYFNNETERLSLYNYYLYSNEKLSITGINDWERYCQNNNYNLINLKYEFLIKLKPDAKTLILYNMDAYDEFINMYGYYSGQDTFDLIIRCEEINNDYQGIVMPYVLPKKFYMGILEKIWHCTSACILDLQAVQNERRLN